MTSNHQIPSSAQTVRRGLAGALMLAAALTAVGAEKLPFPPPKPTLATNSVRFEDFVGAEACAKCHPREYNLWKTSTHGQAGGVPGEVKIIARFDGQPLRFKDATVTPTTNQIGEYVFLIAPEDGAGPFELQVGAVVGGGHMQGGGTQSFFQKFADGTMRFLPFDFIRRENSWFVQLRKDMTWAPVSREISLQTDLANWPPHRALGTSAGFSNCQNCHGSQIALRYDLPARGYQTLFQTLKINCESCHGPGRRHLEIMSRPGFEKLADIGMEPLATLTKDQSLQVCFQCHAKKDALREEAYLPGHPFEDFFSLKLSQLGGSPFLIDGRVRSFDYQGNHLFSDCYLNGSMTCVDCHDPHGQDYRDVFSRKLIGRFDNGQCTGCHASKGLSPEKHSHHSPDSPGSQCVACHMPYLQHQGVGRLLGYARSDHSIPIPRPAFDQQLGVENACQKCHQDKSITWQEAAMKTWYGDIKPHPRAIASLLRARDVTEPGAAARLLLLPEENHPMAQAAGLGTWIERFLRPNTAAGADEAIPRLMQLARSSDTDVQSLALLALHVGFDDRADVRSFLSAQLRSLDGRDDAVRRRWAVAADNLGSLFMQRGDLKDALACLEKSLEVLHDSVVILSHLSLARLRSGDTAGAVAALKQAIQVEPHKAALHFQLAQIYAQSGQTAVAISELESGLQYSPNDAKALQMLETLRRP